MVEVVTSEQRPGLSSPRHRASAVLATVALLAPWATVAWYLASSEFYADLLDVFALQYVVVLVLGAVVLVLVWSRRTWPIAAVGLLVLGLHSAWSALRYLTLVWPDVSVLWHLGVFGVLALAEPVCAIAAVLVGWRGSGLDWSRGRALTWWGACVGVLTVGVVLTRLLPWTRTTWDPADAALIGDLPVHECCTLFDGGGAHEWLLGATWIVATLLLAGLVIGLSPRRAGGLGVLTMGLQQLSASLAWLLDDPPDLGRARPVVERLPAGTVALVCALGLVVLGVWALVAPGARRAPGGSGPVST